MSLGHMLFEANEAWDHTESETKQSKGRSFGPFASERSAGYDFRRLRRVRLLLAQNTRSSSVFSEHAGLADARYRKRARNNRKLTCAIY